MLERYLEELKKEAQSHDEQSILRDSLEKLSAAELASLAGVQLPPSMCPQCAGQMVKQGSILVCGCGMVKKSEAECPGGKIRSKGKGRGMGTGKKKGPIGVPVLKKEAGLPRHLKDVLKRMTSLERTGGTLPAGLESTMRGRRGWREAEWMANRLGAHTRGREAASSLVRYPGSADIVRSSGKDLRTHAREGLAEMLSKSSSSRNMPHFTEQDRPEKVKDIYRALKREHPNMPAEMKARIAARQGKPGKQHQGPPYKGPIKTSAAHLLSKLAANEFDPSEIEESVQEAQERESVPIMSRRYGAGGAALGGIGWGGLGYGAGRILGALAPSTRRWAPALGAALGVGGGATLGGVMGARQGAQEATADQIVAAMRARQAFEQGGQSGVQEGALQGFQAGAQQGFMLGAQAGAQKVLQVLSGGTTGDMGFQPGS